MKKSQQPRKKKAPSKRLPLYASPWMALFVLIRNEWLSPRSQ